SFATPSRARAACSAASRAVSTSRTTVPGEKAAAPLSSEDTAAMCRRCNWRPATRGRWRRSRRGSVDQPKQGWVARNWLWVVPVGCLAPLVVCGGGIAMIFVVVFGAIKSSDVYTEALARAKESEEVKALLGDPVEAGTFVSGRIETKNGTGKADLS